MIAPRLTSTDPQERGGGDMAHEIERVHESIRVELGRAGVRLPEARIAAVAEVVLADAVRISLRWLNDG
jgi:hypothetical protein